MKNMKEKKYLITTFVLFVAVASMHFMRVVSGWEIQIGGGTIPMWLSWFAVFFVGYLAYSAFKLYKKK